jgi:hypothetical protein
MTYRTILVVLAILTFAIACQRTETSAPATETQAAAPPPAPAEIAQGLSTPESVLYDAEQDVYFISNINGAATEADDNGFISRVNAETLQAEEKWIDGAKAEVTLHAPKGLAIAGDDLYVSDVTTVRRFDRKTGAPKGEVAIRGASFLNDLATDGTVVYVSDSGLDSKFAPTGKDAIWKIENDKATRFAAGTELKAPNGLAVVDGKVWSVAYKGNELYAIEKGKKANATILPSSGLDGLAVLPDGSFVVTSWDGKAIYRGKPGETFQAVVENVEAPADIGYDSKRNRLLIPHFTQSKVTFHAVQ